MATNPTCERCHREVDPADLTVVAGTFRRTRTALNGGMYRQVGDVSVVTTYRHEVCPEVSAPS